MILYILHPFFNVLLVYIHNTINQHVANIKQIPDQSCTPRKFVRPFFFFSNAPAIGDPIKDAMLETPQDMPTRVPRLRRSGQILAKAAEGSVTRAADRKPGEESARLLHVD